MYLNYEAASRIVTKRTDKHAGASLRSGYYLKHIPELDAYVVQEVLYSTKWAKNERGEYSRAPKSAWKFAPRATLFSNGTAILSSGIKGPFLRNNWKIRIFKSPTVTEPGYFAQMGRDESVAIGPHNAKFMLTSDRKIVRIAPEVERVIDKDLQKEIRTEIKRALRIITVRDKLGAYKDLQTANIQWLPGTSEDVKSASLLIHSASTATGAAYENRVSEAAKALYRLVQSVDDSNLESANDLIKIALCHARWTCWTNKKDTAYCVKRFLDSRMRLLYLALGAETFVEKKC